MRLAEELHIGKPLERGQELALSVLLTREHLIRLMDARVFRPMGLTDSQFNVLRILKGGPEGGCTIGEIRRRVISRSADVPRLVDRMVTAGLVARKAHPSDRRSCHVVLTVEGENCLVLASQMHDALLRELEGLLPKKELGQLLGLLERLRDLTRTMSSDLEEDR